MGATASHARSRTRSGRTSARRCSRRSSRGTFDYLRARATVFRSFSTIPRRAAREPIASSPRSCSPCTQRSRWGRKRRRIDRKLVQEVAMRKALGRGLEVLLPAAPVRTATTAPPPAPVANVAPATGQTARLSDITTNPDQPRRRFDPETLEALADSIRRHGLLQPLVVRPTEGGFELIAGERRLRAARQAGLDEVPVVIRTATPPERLELALIENLQREALTALEEAEAYRLLMDVYGLTQDDIARRVGKSRPAIANALRLLALPDVVKAQLENNELTAGHAR